MKGKMKYFFLSTLLCLMTGTTVFAQQEEKKETDAKDSIVYISNGCTHKSYHNTMHCSKLMKCRHEHQGAAMKDCKNSCPHTGHVVATTLKEALEQEKTECYVCCKKIKL